ncbi:uncharacterized protein PgNI_02752 [Pyricularia grisea]|uniref:Heterokaryon incompatibility domain-containing protein n=1 Tax=Pyricularia grisea TaxID=148305 RepID=A0A6P8BCV0_PYRGI|nr:uncharacterized protein PgNI_02752 [Pyricularia grisea]TLD13633.1 hypothetical protein PgNI_02752 [Pyricularia grisea]
MRPVENWDKKRVEGSKVQKCVFDRALGYMHQVGVGLLWIDAHCIRQGADDCDDQSRSGKPCYSLQQ